MQDQNDRNETALTPPLKNGLKSEVDLNSKLNVKSGTNDIHESVKDLDMSREGFKEAAL